MRNENQTVCIMQAANWVCLPGVCTSAMHALAASIISRNECHKKSPQAAVSILAAVESSGERVALRSVETGNSLARKSIYTGKVAK